MLHIVQVVLSGSAEIPKVFVGATLVPSVLLPATPERSRTAQLPEASYAFQTGR